MECDNCTGWNCSNCPYSYREEEEAIKNNNIQNDEEV